MSVSPAAKTPAFSLRQAAARFWLNVFFWFSDHAPRFLAAARPVICLIVFACSRSIRRGTMANARRLLGPASTRAEQNRLARRTLASFFQFCCEVGRSRRASVEELRGQVQSISGEAAYDKARAARRGMIVVTAHMGSFEVAMATLRAKEPRVQVLFRRDAVGLFERQRAELRRRLGIFEAGLEEGVGVWIRLREALLADDVVVIQGDRVLPGQKGQPIPFQDGQMEMPASPIALAMVTGAPILPIFSVRTATGQIRLIIEEPIYVPENSAVDRGEVHPAMLALARVIQRQILAFPEQWHVLEPAWREDIDQG